MYCEATYLAHPGLFKVTAGNMAHLDQSARVKDSHVQFFWCFSHFPSDQLLDTSHTQTHKLIRKALNASENCERFR